MITVMYSSIYHFSKRKVFNNLAEAQEYAQEWIGRFPTISRTFQYAVSDDGIGKITVAGCTIYELFPGAE